MIKPLVGRTSKWANPQNFYQGFLGGCWRSNCIWVFATVYEGYSWFRQGDGSSWYLPGGALFRAYKSGSLGSLHPLPNPPGLEDSTSEQWTNWTWWPPGWSLISIKHWHQIPISNPSASAIAVPGNWTPWSWAPYCARRSHQRRADSSRRSSPEFDSLRALPELQTTVVSFRPSFPWQSFKGPLKTGTPKHEWNSTDPHLNLVFLLNASEVRWTGEWMYIWQCISMIYSWILNMFAGDVHNPSLSSWEVACQMVGTIATKPLIWFVRSMSLKNSDP